MTGFEPVASSFAEKCSVQLSYIDELSICECVRQDSNLQSPGSKPGALSSWASDA